MKNELRKLYRKARIFHEMAYGVVLQTRQRTVGGAVSLDELADSAFVAREIAVLANDLRKEFEAAQGLLEKIACLAWVTAHAGEPEQAEPIRAELVVATPSLKQMASLPRLKKDPKAYNRLMLHLGVPEACRELVRPHWPSMVEHLTNLAEQGRPLPPGIDPNKTYPVYKLTMRRRPDVEI